MNVIELKNISKNFADLEVLKNIDLTVEQGQVLGLFGHNGAGKTTTMKMILGLIKPSSGSINVFEQDPCLPSFHHHRFQLGFLPENVSFYQHLSGFEVLMFFAKLKKVSKNRVNELLKQVGLWQAKDRKVKTYSKGMKQRLGLSQALLTRPALLLLDEPTVGLDPIATQEFYQIIEDLRETGCSIILCSHILAGLESHIDKAAILSGGKLKAFGSVEQLRAQTPLETEITFRGCFDTTSLSAKLAHEITNLADGNFKINVLAEKKLALLKQLISEPGLSDLSVKDAGLEQIYRYYIEQDHELLYFPDQDKRQTTDSTQVTL